jgi:hypothetical protein
MHRAHPHPHPSLRGRAVGREGLSRRRTISIRAMPSGNRMPMLTPTIPRRDCLNISSTAHAAAFHIIPKGGSPEGAAPPQP